MDCPNKPTAEQCSKHERVADVQGCPAFACWYPQMGGYVGMAVVVMQEPSAGSAGVNCFDAYIWHDGEFPFDEGQPTMLHHCMPEQFIRFGELVIDMQRQHAGRVDG